MIGRNIAVFSLVVAAFVAGMTEVYAQDYEAEYEQLQLDFPGSMNDANDAQALADRADDLYKRIRDYRKASRSELPKDELDQLRDFYREVRDFKSFVRVAGQLRNTAYTGIEPFDTVAARLGLEPRVLQTLDSGLQLVRIDVADFGSVLIRNPTKTTFALIYSVNDPERPGGVGSATCESYSVMSGLFNSRDRKIEGLQLTASTQATPVGSDCK